jgi:hypothetical protein
MYYSTVALAAFFAATMAPSPIAARTVLPNLSKKAADVDEEYDCQVHVDTGKDTHATPEELAIFEQALMLSANEVYGTDEMHLDKAAVKTSKHGPKALMTTSMEAANADANAISTKLLRGEAQSGGSMLGHQASIYSTWYGVTISARCYLCRDDDSFMENAFLEATKKKGGKKGGDKHALWEETLCDLLNQTPAFDNAEDCEIVVSHKGKVEPVFEAGPTMGVITTEFFDVEEEKY